MTHNRLALATHGFTRFLVGVAVVLSLALGPVARAAEIPAEQTALLVLKVLGYDQHFAERSTQTRVVVLFAAGDDKSESRSEELLAALEAATAKYRVQGTPLSATAIGVREAADADSALAEGASALFVCPGLEAHLATILAESAEHDILSFTGTESLFDEGVGVGLVLAGTRPKLLVNLPTVVDEGASLDASFLGVADVRR